jgi:hypothetical protein
MNTMNMPGFTAEDSLYKTGGHYQTSRHAIDSSTQIISRIYPAAAKMEEEVIVITEQWPPDPWTPWPPPSGGGQGGTPIPPFEGGDGGGGGGATGGGQPPTPSDIGRGPKLTTLKRIGFECKGGMAPLKVQQCHSCADTAAGRSCICYDCEEVSRDCGEAYDCTGTYGKTG